MKHKNLIFPIIFIFIIIIGVWYQYKSPIIKPSTVTLEEAIEISKTSECSQKGTVGTIGSYDGNTKMWQIDFVPQDKYAQTGCSSVCVVSEISKSATINWNCQNATTSPSLPPSSPATKDDLIKVTSPLPNASVKSPLTISGEARGYWYFEAQFPVKIYDAKGKLLGSVPAMATKEWMTENYVPFTATLTFDTPTTATGTIVFEKDNPSDLPQNSNQLVIPITFSKTNAPAERAVTLYYYDSSKDRDSEGNVLCSRQGLVPVTRQIPITKTPIQDAIRLLLQGKLTPEEKAKGITTEYPLAGVTLKSASQKKETLTLTFDDPQNRTGGGSCRVGILWFQIEATAKQFSGITSVKFAPEELFQP